MLERLSPGTAEATLPWLIGCWSTTRNGVTIEERWTVEPNGSLDGQGRTLRGGKVVGSEVVRITGLGDSLRYTADPSGQSVATFAATVSHRQQRDLRQSRARLPDPDLLPPVGPCRIGRRNRWPGPQR